MSGDEALACFHPATRAWFLENIGTPTDIQRQVWPVSSAGEHILLTAPTGSGKTLAAFLWALDRLLSGAWEAGALRVLYISPLKALGNDIQKNLLGPLTGLRGAFEMAGQRPPELRALTRSGDTPQTERQRMLRRPPEILITTPESLNILLTSRRGRELFTGLKAVILDEIHAIAGGRRGVHLMTAVERLTELTGEFQRIALSATIQPLETAAAFVGGFRRLHADAAPSSEAALQPRPVRVLSSAAPKRYELTVRAAPLLAQDPGDDDVWTAMASDFLKRIAANRSTLFFTNSRRLAERLTRLINEAAGESLALCHHGSLSRELRLAAEERLKSGELRAIVATSSLELGIDIGSVDEVVLVQTPRTVASTLQRLGRAGHGVGQTSRGAIYPSHGRDYLDAALMARATLDRDIEALKPLDAPLDVLAQILVSIAIPEERSVDEVYGLIRQSYSYRNLDRREFDLTLEMLAGRYADSRIRELRPRIALDRIRGVMRARDGADRVLYMSGGVIPDRGYFDLRLLESSAKIGELDEEFVWERSLGDNFSLGNRYWKIVAITHNDVFAIPGENANAVAPFWRAETEDRGLAFCDRLAQFLAEVNDRLNDPALREEIARDYALEPLAADRLVEFLREQRSAANGAPLPQKDLLLIERFHDPINQSDQMQVILHTLRGGRVNRPLSLALKAAWRERYGVRLAAMHDDDAVLIALPPDFAAAELLELLAPERIEALLRLSLESSGYFGARFRENAGRALLLPPRGFRTRLPLWFNRMRAKKLMEATARYADFPILLETWRTCLRDEFELGPLVEYLHDLRTGAVRIVETATRTPSPFARNLTYQETNYFMYADDSPAGESQSNLDDALISRVAYGDAPRTQFDEATFVELEARLKRTAPGYAPHSALELTEWIKERVLIPLDEWRELRAAVARDGGEFPPDEALQSTALAALAPGATVVCITATETLAELAGALSENPERLLALVSRFLAHYGPIAPEFLDAVFGLAPGFRADLVDRLQRDRRIVASQFGRATPQICDAQNAEHLLRLERRRARQKSVVLPLAKLPLFLAALHGMARKDVPPANGRDGPAAVDALDALKTNLDRLLGFPASAALWETELLPARPGAYQPALLDAVFADADLYWFGCGRRTLSFAFAEDLELYLAESQTLAPERLALRDQLFREEGARYPLLELAARAGRGAAETTEALWDLAWNGLAAADSFAVVRRAAESSFRSLRTAPGGRLSRPGGQRWSTGRASGGLWQALPVFEVEKDTLRAEELVRARLRQLFLRYGVLFRELLEQEAPALRWRRVFRTLRLMELSGEIAGGYFFEGVSGLQFASAEALRLLAGDLPEDAFWWCSARDPVSLCGRSLPGFSASLPPRAAGAAILWQGARPLVISRRFGQSLDIAVPPDDPALPGALAMAGEWVRRTVQPLGKIQCATINGVAAVRSPYRAAMLAAGFQADYRYLILRRGN